MGVLEVGWRLGLPLEGVNFPGHFLVRFRGEALDLLVDPFDGGKLRFEEQAQELLDRAYGGVVRLQPSFMREVTNLKSVYMRVGDHERALAAVERILMLTPTAPTENRSRGLLLVRLGRRDEATKQLEKYLRVAPGASDADRVEDMLRDLRAGRDPADVEGL